MGYRYRLKVHLVYNLSFPQRTLLLSPRGSRFVVLGRTPATICNFSQEKRAWLNGNQLQARIPSLTDLCGAAPPTNIYNETQFHLVSY